MMVVQEHRPDCQSSNRNHLQVRLVKDDGPSAQIEAKFVCRAGVESPSLHFVWILHPVESQITRRHARPCDCVKHCFSVCGGETIEEPVIRQAHSHCCLRCPLKSDRVLSALEEIIPFIEG